jgi:hypothetical protein
VSRPHGERPPPDVEEEDDPSPDDDVDPPPDDDVGPPPDDVEPPPDDVEPPPDDVEPPPDDVEPPPDDVEPPPDEPLGTQAWSPTDAVRKTMERSDGSPGWVRMVTPVPESAAHRNPDPRQTA